MHRPPEPSTDEHWPANQADDGACQCAPVLHPVCVCGASDRPRARPPRARARRGPPRYT